MSTPREAMATAGRRPSADMLVDVERLVGAYYDEHPDPSDPGQAVSLRDLGSSRHARWRGRSTRTTSWRSAQAIARYRAAHGISGPLFLGRDTHALSEPAFRTAVEVLAATRRRRRRRFRGRLHAHAGDLARDPDAQRARRREGGRDRDHAVAQPARRRRLQVQPAAWRPGRHRRHAADPGRGERAARGRACAASSGWPTSEAIKRARRHDYRSAYVEDLATVVDLEAIARRRDPAGGRPAGRRERRVLAGDRGALPARPRRSSTTESTRRSRSCRSTTTARSAWTAPRPDAMAGLISLKDRFDVAFANDPDADRHGIVTRSAGLLNPNHYLAAAIAYLFGGARRDWPADAGVGKTLVSSSIIDRVVAGLGAPARGSARSDSSGSSPACSTARWRSAARRAPAPASCAATAAPGRPTRTG